MKILVDSHIFIWLLYEPERITVSTSELIKSADEVFVSVASLWELTLKFCKGKLAYSPQMLTDGVEALNLKELLITGDHIRRLPKIKLPHSDPFDRLLIAQSEAENCSFLTVDSQLLGTPYNVINAGQ